jgi:hypothetical protein
MSVLVVKITSALVVLVTSSQGVNIHQATVLHSPSTLPKLNTTMTSDGGAIQVIDAYLAENQTDRHPPLDSPRQSDSSNPVGAANYTAFIQQSMTESSSGGNHTFTVKEIDASLAENQTDRHPPLGSPKQSDSTNPVGAANLTAFIQEAVTESSSVGDHKSTTEEMKKAEEMKNQINENVQKKQAITEESSVGNQKHSPESERFANAEEANKRQKEREEQTAKMKQEMKDNIGQALVKAGSLDDWEYEGSWMVGENYRPVNAFGKLDNGWPPRNGSTCEVLLGEDWPAMHTRIKWWFGELMKRMSNKIWKPIFHECCGENFPFNSGVSYSFAGGGCPSLITNANFMDVASWYLPGAEVFSVVSAGSWYSAIDHYGNQRWPDGRGTRMYPEGNWNRLLTSHEMDMHQMGIDHICADQTFATALAKKILRVMLDRKYWLYFAWEDTVYEAYLGPAGLPEDLKYGQAVSQYGWVQEFCADWAPVTTIMKRDFHTGTPFMYGLWPYFRRRYELTELFQTAVAFGDPFGAYEHMSFKSIIGMSSSFFGTVLGVSHVAWQLMCDKYQSYQGCVTNTNIPPAWFDDAIDALILPIDWNMRAIYNSGKRPFIDGTTERAAGWDCPPEPNTVIGKFRKLLQRSYHPCQTTDGGWADVSGFLANLVTREWVVVNSPMRRYYAQNKILTVQSMPDMSMIPLMSGMSMEKLRKEYPRDAAHLYGLAYTYKTGANMGGPYGNPCFVPFDVFDPFHANDLLMAAGISAYPTNVVENEDLGTQGNYSLLLNFAAMVKNDFAMKWRSELPPKYAISARLYNFPEYMVNFAYPPEATKALGAYAEYEALKQVYFQRWTGYCWAWLDYMSHEDWFADAVCFCFSAPYRYLGLHQKQFLNGVAPWHLNVSLPEHPLEWFTTSMAGMAFGFYGRPHFPIDGPVDTIQDIASYLLTHEVMDYIHEAQQVGSIPDNISATPTEARNYLPPFWAYPLKPCATKTIERFHEIKTIINALPKCPMGSLIPSVADAQWRWGQSDEYYAEVIKHVVSQAPMDSHGAMWGYNIRGKTDYAVSNVLPKGLSKVMESLQHMNEMVDMPSEWLFGEDGVEELSEVTGIEAATGGFWADMSEVLR